VKCSSLTGLIGCMRREDFLRLENQTFAWQTISQNARGKEAMIDRRMGVKKEVEVRLTKELH
jgi:hypothetical protein